MSSMLTLNRYYDIDIFNRIDINMFEIYNNDIVLVFILDFEHYFNAVRWFALHWNNVQSQR